MKIAFKRSLWGSLILVILLLSILCINVQAKQVIVDEDNNVLNEINNLCILKEPTVENFNITSNVGSRAEYYRKSKGSSKSKDIDSFVNNKEYKTNNILGYQDEYGSMSILINNPQPSDTVTVEYGSIGKYKEKYIDMKIEVSNIKYKKATGIEESNIMVLDFSESPYSGFIFGNITEMEFTYQFFYANTKEEIEFSKDSYLTFNSLNTGEYVNYLNYDTTKADSEVDHYIIKNSNVIYKNSINPEISNKSAFTGISNDFEDVLGAETFTKNTVSFQIKGKKQKFLIGCDLSRAWNTISSGTLFNVQPFSPVKKSKNINNIDISGKEVNTSDTFYYEIDQKVNTLGQDIIRKYNSFVITDTLDNNLSYVKAELYDTNNSLINNSGEFSYDSSKNKVTFIADNDFFKNKIKYNGESYKLRIYVKLKPLVADSNSKDITINNVAQCQIDKISKSSNEVKNYLKVYNININHLDKHTDNLILKETEKKFNGEKYLYSPRYDLTKDGAKYTPTSMNTQSGVVNGKDIEVKFYYKAPLITVGLEKIQIYTAKSIAGLPVHLDIKGDLHYEIGETDDFKESTITLSLYKGNSRIKSQTYNLDDLPNDVSWIIPSSYLTVDEQANYTMKLEDYNSDDVVVEAKEIDTDGYSSSEKEIVAYESKDLTYKGVVMTERSYGGVMKVYYETLNIPSSVLQKQKTGYGFKLDTDIYYSNDLGKDATFGIRAIVDSNLIDSYINEEYISKNSYTNIDMELVTSDSSQDKKEYAYFYKLPKVSVERKTGYLFTDNQIKNKNSKITNSMVNTDRKLYAPIWAELGNYKVRIESAKPVGINLVNFMINKNLNLYAFMYGHIDSPTIAMDEILIEPVDTKSPFPDGRPENWSDSDIQWLKNN